MAHRAYGREKDAVCIRDSGNVVIDKIRCMSNAPTRKGIGAC